MLLRFIRAKAAYVLGPNNKDYCLSFLVLLWPSVKEKSVIFGKAYRKDDVLSPSPSLGRPSGVTQKKPAGKYKRLPATGLRHYRPQHPLEFAEISQQPPQ